MSNRAPKKPAPTDWPRMSSCVFYEDAPRAIDWLCEAFGFDVRLRVEGEGGRIEHCELSYGDGLVMIGQAGGSSHREVPFPSTSPRTLGGMNTQALCVVVDDCDAHCEAARGAGAVIAMPPTTNDYGEDYWTDRTYEAVDLEGHHWWFLQRLRDGKAKS